MSDLKMTNAGDYMKDLDQKCNCGRAVRYISPDGVGSCNKYVRCPTYEDLEKNAGELFNDLMHSISAAHDLNCFREGTSRYKEAEAVVNAMVQKYQLEGVCNVRYKN